MGGLTRGFVVALRRSGEWWVSPGEFFYNNHHARVHEMKPADDSKRLKGGLFPTWNWRQWKGKNFLQLRPAIQAFYSRAQKGQDDALANSIIHNPYYTPY